MKTLILVFSFTGNNAKFAKSLAVRLNCDCVRLREKKNRSRFSIFLDFVFQRHPALFPFEKDPGEYDYIILVAPVWFGKIASPIRSLIKKYGQQFNRYAVFSLGAGFDGKAYDLQTELKNLANIPPHLTVNLLISDLMPAVPKPTRQMLDKYRINEQDVQVLVNKAVEFLDK